MKVKKIKGSCLCSKINYEYCGDAMVFQYCHCSRCKKFTGSEHASNIIIDPNNFTWTKGEELVGTFILKEAKYFATAFCKNCGSSLPWMSQSGKAIIIPAGTLDDDPKIKPKHNIFYHDKAPWYVSVDDLPKYDELPK
jgi:hypothetical protein